MWIIFLIFHLIGLVGYNLLLRKALTKKIDPWQLATMMQTGIVVPIIFALFLQPPNINSYDVSLMLQIIVIVILVILLHLTNVNALKYLEASVYSVLYNLRIIFTTVLGVVFLGEAIIPLQIIGGLLIFFAVLTVKQKGKKDITKKGVYWGVAASIVISILNLSEKNLLGKVSLLEYAVPVMMIATVVMWAILLVRKQKIDWQLFTDKKILQLMALRAVSAYGFIFAFYSGALLSVATYISSLSLILIVILGVLLLGEKDFLKRKIIAVIMATLGLTTIFIANVI